jgi:hypothetical protein
VVSKPGFRDDLTKRLRQLDFRQSPYNPWYQQTYAPFVEFFRERIAIPNLEHSDAMIGVALVYSWMPTLPQKKCRWNSKAARAALLICTKGDPKSELLEVIKSFVGGSMIATSKFLHFCAPDKYPIWDSRVVQGGYGRAWGKRDNEGERYLEYMEHLQNLRLPEPVRAKIKQLNPNCSALRAKEFALFSLGSFELQKRRSEQKRRES